jgi:hypothetical protein
LITILFTLAILAAVDSARHVVAWRTACVARLRRPAAPLSSRSTSARTATWTSTAGRWCFCGGYLERTGEGTREANGRRFRIARLACQECEALDEVFFDTTDVLH